MLKSGCIILTIWSLLNFAASSVILTNTLLGRGHTPAIYLMLSEADVSQLSPKIVATIDSIAAFANGLNIAFCLLSTVVVWRGLFRGTLWCFWALMIGYTAAFGAGVAGDYMVGAFAVQVSGVSGMILAWGLGLAALGLNRLGPGAAKG